MLESSSTLLSLAAEFFTDEYAAFLDGRVKEVDNFVRTEMMKKAFLNIAFIVDIQDVEKL